MTKQQIVQKIIDIMMETYDIDYDFDSYWECPDYYFGLRKDDYNYNIRDICFNSHQLYRIPAYDDDELIYPEGEGHYEGYYDAGELDGTCSIGIENPSEKYVSESLKQTDFYSGEHLYLIKGKYAEEGSDIGEYIISDAEVVYKFY